MIYIGGSKKRAPESDPAKLYRPSDRKRADSTINRYLVCLGEAMRLVHWLKDAGGRPLLAELPKVPRLAEPEHLPRPVSDDDLQAIMQRVPQHLADGILLARLMGFRKGEVFALTGPIRSISRTAGCGWRPVRRRRTGPSSSPPERRPWNCSPGCSPRLAAGGNSIC